MKRFIVAAVLMVIALAGCGRAAQTFSTPTNTPSIPATQTFSPIPAPTTPAPTTAAPTPSATPVDQIITRFSGTGSTVTGTFTVPADGEWHLSYAYTNGSLFAGQAENFIVDEKDAATGQLVSVLVNALGIGNGSPTAVAVYDDADAGEPVYFQIITDDASWSVVPVTGTS